MISKFMNKFVRMILWVIVISSIIQFGLWAFIWARSNWVVDEQFGYLVEKVTEMNCLDSMTGEYQLAEEKLLRVNLSGGFLRFPLRIDGFTEKANADDDFVRYKVNDSSPGNDGFKVLHGIGWNQTAYSYETVPQQYEPIKVELRGIAYLPILFYFGREFKDDGSDADFSGGMRFGYMPDSNGQATGLPSLAVALDRSTVVLGNKFYKGLPSGG